MLRKLTIILLGLILFLGGLGRDVALVQYLGIGVGLALLVVVLLSKKKIIVPRSWRFYLVFLLVLAVSNLWHEVGPGGKEYLILYFAGAIFWLASYNLKKELRGSFLWLLILLGLVFAELFVMNRISGVLKFSYQSLYLPNTPYLQHNHLGDFWAVVLAAIGYWLLTSGRRWLWWLIGLGGYFLAVSLSRSSYVALVAGVFYLFARGKWLATNRKILVFYLGLALALFLFAGTFKTLIYSRPYFVQAVAGIIRHPWGVGMGNFYLVSSDPANQLLGMHGLSGFTHNLVLEFMVGMGLLGLVFVAWLTRVTFKLFQDKNPQNLLFQAVFVTIGVNFLFDYTYIIPAMVWLWFIALGLAYKDEESLLIKKSRLPGGIHPSKFL